MYLTTNSTSTMVICAQTLWNEPMLMGSSFLPKFKTQPKRQVKHSHYCKRSGICKRGVIVSGVIFPVDPWAPSIDSQSIASQLFAVSLFPYLGFLYFITKSNSAPKLTLFGFYFLLAFVGATSEFLWTSNLTMKCAFIMSNFPIFYFVLHILFG